jgi:anti-sigma regulatory factor (Ser/Thr protein kinase)
MTEPRVLHARPKRRAFPGRADQITLARDFTKRTLGSCPVADDAVLLVNELATNALEHTMTGNGGQFEVTIYCDEGSLLIGVTDNGSDTTPARGALDLESETGRGLGICPAARSEGSRRLAWRQRMPVPGERPVPALARA